MDNSIGIGDLAAILTAAGVTIYVLGLVGLAIPIRRHFTGDLSTAWYAVALIPKTVVAGQGARIWLGSRQSVGNALKVIFGPPGADEAHPSGTRTR